jgi:hypothetical protein
MRSVLLPDLMYQMVCRRALLQLNASFLDDSILRDTFLCFSIQDQTKQHLFRSGLTSSELKKSICQKRCGCVTELYVTLMLRVGLCTGSLRPTGKLPSLKHTSLAALIVIKCWLSSVLNGSCCVDFLFGLLHMLANLVGHFFSTKYHGFSMI